MKERIFISIKPSIKHIGDIKPGELVVVRDRNKLLLVTKDEKGRLKKLEFQDV